MSAQISAYGRLGGDPRPIETRTGTSMTVASVAVDVADPRDRGEDGAGEAPPLWLGIVAFGRQAETLARHGKGDLVSVCGRLQSRRYTAKDGSERDGLQCVADAILSARSTRPGGGRRRGGSGVPSGADPAPPDPDGPEPPPFDDRLPF